MPFFTTEAGAMKTRRRATDSELKQIEQALLTAILERGQAGTDDAHELPVGKVSPWHRPKWHIGVHLCHFGQDRRNDDRERRAASNVRKLYEKRLILTV